ncbi:cyclopropane fatty acyl phospholipid synthase [Candidatus Daviesbacteria bacterium]|nr:cyclopropane fatty acyl phospholipid synthase [Candidatus Daviesbacteria bacterium]
MVRQFLKTADIEVGGKHSWDIQVKNENFYRRFLHQEPTLAFGQSYMAGEWESEKIDEAAAKIIKANLHNNFKSNKPWLQSIKEKVLSLGRKKDPYIIAKRHYDLGNDLFKAMLDKRMVYTCGYWKEAQNLDEAQEAKLDLVCRKIGLQKGMKVLDIGGGWGSFAIFAAQKYGAYVVNVTISKEQVKLADERAKGLPVENRLQDYRDVNGQFDRIVSLGMFEHVRAENYLTFMKVVDKNLKPGGLFLLHTIGLDGKSGTSASFLGKYIFPNSALPSLEQINRAFQDTFVLEDLHNFGTDYDKTLMAWFSNFDKNWPGLRDKYGEQFYRMWKFYLLSCAGAFRARYLQLWQIVFSKKGLPGGYQSIR